MPLYFAYGLNMDRAAMAARCPASRWLGRARLPRHRFVVTEEGYASVMRDPLRAVWGVLWELALADVPALERGESAAGGLYRKVQQPVITDAGPRLALLHLGPGVGSGRARPDVLQAVLAAARSAALPEAYLRELATLLPSGLAKPTSSAAVAEPRPRPAVTPTRASPQEPERDRNANWSWEP